jgi:hypothetical protein
VDICCWKLKQIAKIEFGSEKKIQLTFQRVHTWPKSTGYTLISMNHHHMRTHTTLATTQNSGQKKPYSHHALGGG